ncbi:D-glycero-beta-D-manno-heptose-7-phosphate kinase [candidate division KSB1 bacterium]|nr:D-glycero-beta-D-manno-heptose-7-phosphate kinase [candidate division KSB1 bacterium]RQW01802.1 MAG: D-glycero-beta-D-manno-heptose-7-phosphate kinase [candidate division KSB1 bacterium]
MTKKLTAKRIKSYIKYLQKQRILVLGDLMLDEFIWGSVNRISPEAPVPVVQVMRESAFPGGAANVARNITDFGATAIIGGMIGQDENGAKLLAILEKSGIATNGIISVPEFSTIVKTRIIAQHQQIVRVDREKKKKVTQPEIDDLLSKLRDIVRHVDAIIIEDYGKGFITQALVEQIITLAADHLKLVTVDPNPANPLDWAGAALVKPNRKEAFSAAGLPYTEEEHSIREIGDVLLEKWRVKSVLITLGEEGMMLFDPPEKPYHIPTRAREVFDVSGAGDTVIAYYTMAIAAGLSSAHAAEIANHAAGVVVGKLGTATLTPAELATSFDEQEKPVRVPLRETRVRQIHT